MKIFLKGAMLLGILVFLGYGTALASPFASTGTIEPDYGSSWDAGAGTGTARIKLFIDEVGVSVDYITLEFESDIFDFTGWDASNITVVSPGDWSTTVTSDAQGYRFSLSTAGTETVSGVILDVDYALLDAAMYDSATGDSWSWDEGQPWALSYTMGDSGDPTTVSGGSTGPPVPEPSSMLLFGCGLAGFAVLRRAKAGKTV